MCEKNVWSKKSTSQDNPIKKATHAKHVKKNWNKSCAGTPDATYNEVVCFPASQKGKREDELHTWIDCV